MDIGTCGYVDALYILKFDTNRGIDISFDIGIWLCNSDLKLCYRRLF